MVYANISISVPVIIITSNMSEYIAYSSNRVLQICQMSRVSWLRKVRLLEFWRFNMRSWVWHMHMHTVDTQLHRYGILRLMQMGGPLSQTYGLQSAAPGDQCWCPRYRGRCAVDIVSICIVYGSLYWYSCVFVCTCTRQAQDFLVRIPSQPSKAYFPQSSLFAQLP